MDTINIIKTVEKKIHNKEYSVELFELIRISPSIEEYFFENISDINIFPFLKTEGFLDPEKAPLPIHDKEKGTYLFPPWYILFYLEKISPQLNTNEHKEIINDIINLIKEVSNRIQFLNIEFANYVTWMYFLRIVSALPNDEIDLELISKIKIWLSSSVGIATITSIINEALLAKFLNPNSSDEDIQKAELIIDMISGIIKGKKEELSPEFEELFGKEEKYKLISDGYFYKEIIDNYYEIIAEKCSDNIIYTLCDILKTAIKKGVNTYSSFEDDLSVSFAIYTNDNFYEVMTAIGEKNDDYFILGKELEKKHKPKKEIKFSFTANGLSDFSEKFQKLLLENEIIKNDNERIKLSRGRYIYYGPYSLNCWESMKDNDYLSYHNADDMILYSLKNILVQRSNMNIESSKTLLKKLFLDDYFIFKKLALFIIGESSNNYSDIFWESFKINDNSNILLEESFFGDELKNAFEKIELNESQQIELKNVIEEGPKFHYSELNDEYFMIWKQKIYKALSRYDIFKVEFEKLFRRTNKDYELRPAIGAVDSQFEDESTNIIPLNIDSIIQMSNQDIADKLIKTKETEYISDTENFYPTLMEAIKTKPEKFSNDLSPFLKAHYSDIYNLLYYLDEAWKNKKYFDWRKLFDFIFKYISKVNYEDISKPADYYRGSVSLRDIIGIIGILIQDGTRNDDNAFPVECNEQAGEILLTILSNFNKLIVPYKEEDYHDSYLFALNTILGRNIFALILLSLREARTKLEDPEGGIIKWNEKYKKIYETLIDNSVYEAYLFLGNSIRNFIYLDSKWAFDKILSITKIRNSNILLWNAFMNGYLTNIKISENLFNTMIENYNMSVDFDFKDKSSRRGLIKHIALAYLGGADNLKNGLISKIILRESYEDYRELINYFWAKRESLLTELSSKNDKFSTSEQKKLILEFWKTVYLLFIKKKILSEESKKILSHLGKLSIYIDQIDNDNFKWLILSARYTTIDFVSPFFIEYLNILKNKGKDKEFVSSAVGKIYLSILNEATPDYDMKNIKEIIEYLFSSGNKEAIDSANLICNIYTERSNYSLKEIWEKYNII